MSTIRPSVARRCGYELDIDIDIDTDIDIWGSPIAYLCDPHRAVRLPGWRAPLRSLSTIADSSRCNLPSNQSPLQVSIYLHI